VQSEQKRIRQGIELRRDCRHGAILEGDWRNVATWGMERSAELDARAAQIELYSLQRKRTIIEKTQANGKFDANA
jgi:hypothetical protein